MKTVSFEIAKKMGKPAPGLQGIMLSSLRGDGIKAAMLLQAPSLDELKEKARQMREQGYTLTCRTRGRSLEVTALAGSGFSALDGAFEYASRLKFAMDDVCDVVSFCSSAGRALNGAMTLEEISLDRESLSLKVSAELEDGLEPEAFFSSLMELLEKADMGVIKK